MVMVAKVVKSPRAEAVVEVGSNDERKEEEVKGRKNKENAGGKPMEWVGQVGGVVGAEEEGVGEEGAEQVEMDEKEAGGQKEAPKRKSDQSAGGEAKASRVEERRRSQGAGQVEDSSDEEGAEDSDSPLILTNSQTQKLYTADEISLLLYKTKNIKKVEVKDHFPDLVAFEHSCHYHMAKKKLDMQEVFRIRKILPKVKECIQQGEVESFNVCFN